MLGDHDTIATIAVKDLQVARDFYEGVLGFSPRGDSPEGMLYGAGSGAFLVYPSSFAGTNQATSMSFQVAGAAFDAEVAALRDNGVTFRPSTPPASAGTTASRRWAGTPAGCGSPTRTATSSTSRRVSTPAEQSLVSGRARAEQGARGVDRGIRARLVDVEVPHGAHPTRPHGIRAHALLEQGGDELRCLPTDLGRRRARRCWSRRWPRRRRRVPPPRTPPRTARARAWSSASRSTWWSSAYSPAAARMPTCRIPPP